MSIPPKQIIASFASRQEFMNLLQVNPGLVILKMGAEWCGPCKKIRPVLDAFFATSPPEVVCADIDVDESFDLYAYFKSKKMVNGIPVILCYKKGNNTFIPDDSVTGADPTELDKFFQRCVLHLSILKRSDPSINANAKAIANS
jgi:thiol-disulfide isomerase/thioredoxin